MEVSSFQFQRPVLSKIDFETFPNDSLEEDAKIEAENQFKVKVEKSQSENRAKVTLCITALGKIQEEPFFKIYAEIYGIFSWNEIRSDKMVDQLLKQNASSLLLSYARPIISNITCSSIVSHYDIPFINFSDSTEQGQSSRG